MTHYNLIPLLPWLLMVGLLIYVIAFTLTDSSVKTVIKYLIVPILAISLIVSVTTATNLLGTPYSGVPDKKFELLNFIVTDNRALLTIQIWVMFEDGNTRLYEMPYSPKLAKELRDAMEAKRKTGKSQYGKLTKRKNQNKNDGNYDDFTFEKYKFHYPKFMIKGN